MFAVRCTRKLLSRGTPRELPVPVPPTTVLGDWYANIVFTRPEQLVVCVAERTLLPVVVSAKDVKLLPERVARAAGTMLQEIGVSPGDIAEELSQMNAGYFAPTANRRVLGSLNEAIFRFEYWYAEHPGLSLQQLAMRLAQVPCAPIGYAYPSEATVAAFATDKATKSARSAA